jgi:hypothetical protein
VKAAPTLLGLVALHLGLLTGCGHKQLPPGTPPPEYEVPVVPPWPPAGADAGIEAGPSPEPEPSTEDEGGYVFGEGIEDAGAPPAVLDAGPVEAGAAPAP